MIARVISISLIVAHTLVPAPQTRDTTAPAANATTTISGVVVTDDASARPVRRARVTIGGGALAGDRQTVTDDQGRFAFTGLAAGHYTLSAAKAAWLTAYYGSQRPGRPAYGGSALDVAPGQSLAGLTLRMLHGSAITGTVLDQTGRPASATVQLLQVRTQNGERTLEAAAVSYAMGGTDDRGVYRTYGIPPGEYVVMAVPTRLIGVGTVYQALTDAQSSARQTSPGATGTLPAQGPTVTAAPVYFPGTMNAGSAAPITVGPAEEKTGINFSLQLVPTSRISGVLLGPDGQAAAGGQIRIVSHSVMPEFDGFGGGGMLSSMLSGDDIVQLRPDGRFTIPSVAPGDYTIVARGRERGAATPQIGSRGNPVGPLGRGGAQAAPTLWAMADVSVNGQEIPDVTLTLQPGMTVAGRVRGNGTAAPPFDMSRVRIALVATGSMTQPPPPAQVDGGGGFSFSGVVPGPYRLTIPGLPDGWTLASASIGGVDAVDVPFELHPGESITDVAVRVTDRTSEISGTLLDAAGRPASGYAVVVFPSDRALWLAGSRRVRPPAVPDQAGAFRVTGLPPGEYCVAVATDLDPNDLRDSSVLEELAASSVRVSISEGEKKVQNLKIGGR